jgi:hypothetical protein
VRASCEESRVRVWRGERHKLYGVVVLRQVEGRQGDVVRALVRVTVVTTVAVLVSALAVMPVLAFAVSDVSVAQVLTLHALYLELPRAL